MKNGKGARIAAIKGARYVLAEMHGGVAAGDISVKRVGKNLVIEQQKAGAESASVVIEDFYGNEGQLVGLGADGEYLEYLAAGEPGATEASAITDGASAQLTLAAGQPAFSPSSFALAEGGSSVFSSALSGVAALAAGAALSNNSSGGSKAQPAPAASAFVLEDQRADAVAGQPASASVKPDASTAVQDAGNTAGPVAEVHTEADDVSADDAAINDLSSDANTNENAAINDRASNAITNENAAPAESNTAPEAEAITSPGLVGAPAAVVPFAVDDIPVIEKVMDDHGVIQGVIENGGYTDDVYPTLMGHADPGVKVHVYRGKYLQGYTVADENGVWSYTPSSAYASGTHSMTVKYEYPNKDTSGYSEPYVITIDKIAPGIPKITGILDDEGRITGAITDQTVTDDNRPTITGTAEANAKLIVYDKGKQIGSTTVGADGTWSFTPDTPLADGLHMLSYSAVDRAGNSGEQTDVTEFTVDTRPEKINIYYAEDDVGSITDEVFSGGATDDSTPTLFGTATAGGIVKIYEGSVLLGQVVADVDGTWQFTPPAALSEGAHVFHATVTLVAKGESGPSRPFMLEVDLTAPNIPTIEQVLDDVGAEQGVIANGQHTDDATPTLSGKAEAGSTVRIYDNGSLLGMAVTNANGVWTFTPGVALAEGEHMFTISATDAAGNTTASPAQYEISIDSTRRACYAPNRRVVLRVEVRRTPVP
ncbi:Ig-like domain-containing protein [Stenotrophomonas terrae]|uniref:Ig-like domain-containing protein n=1 Tax=Stenotrophomonas terrae TaxID=405446 RepID=UPI0032079B92